MVSADELNIYSMNGTILGVDDIRIYNFAGQDVTFMNGRLSGFYIVTSGNKAVKIHVR
jgi:hypothetical protein